MEKKNSFYRSGVILTSNKEKGNMPLARHCPGPRRTGDLPDLHKKQRGGFTLIELLVVVLIIGILAAVAVPQYQKAVIKSRYATLKNAVNTIAKAQQLYFLTTGEYAEDFDTLSVDLPIPQQIYSSQSVKFYIYDGYYCADAKSSVWCGLGSPTNPKIIYEFFVSPNDPTLHVYKCLAYTQDKNDSYHQLCKQERSLGFVE